MRSTVESKNAPRWLAEFGRLGQRPVEQVGQGGEDHEHEAEQQVAGADGEGRPDAEHETGDRQVVGRQLRAPQEVAERLDGLVDRRSELAVEHSPQATARFRLG